jgi:hypothetical protein
MIPLIDLRGGFVNDLDPTQASPRYLLLLHRSSKYVATHQAR